MKCACDCDREVRPGRKYISGHNLIVRIREDPTYQSRALAAAIAKDPNHQSKAASMSDGKRTIKIAKLAADKFFLDHPEVKSEAGRRSVRTRLRQNPNLMIDLSKKGFDVQMARDGQIGLAKIVHHEGHIHRGNTETRFCKTKVWPFFSHDLIHCNVPFHRHGIDFVIAKSAETWDPKNPDTWDHIIEPYQVYYWLLDNKTTSLSYISERLSFLRSYSVKCPIHFLVHDKDGLTTCTDIFRTLHLVITP